MKKRMRLLSIKKARHCYRRYCNIVLKERGTPLTYERWLISERIEINVPRSDPKRNGTDRHHLLNKCRGGTWAAENIVRLNTKGKHEPIHRVFKNDDPYAIVRTLEDFYSIFKTYDVREAAKVLLRLCRMKGYEHIDPRIRGLYAAIAPHEGGTGRLEG